MDLAVPAVAAEAAAAAARTDQAARAAANFGTDAGAHVPAPAGTQAARAKAADTVAHVARAAHDARPPAPARSGASVDTSTRALAFAWLSGSDSAVAVDLTEDFSMARDRTLYVATAAAVGSTADGDLATAIAVAVAYALALALDTLQRRSDTLSRPEPCARPGPRSVQRSDTESEQRDRKGEGVRAEDES